MTGGLLAELKRRNVLRMAGLYLVSAWLVVQVGATLLPVFDAPAWTMKALVVTLAVAFLPSIALAWAFELTPQGVMRDADVPASQSIAPQNARRLDRAIIVVLVLAVGYFAFDKFVLSPRRDAALVAETTRVAESRAAKPAKRGNSIAVLPLANASGDESQQFFSDGLSENLIDALSKFEGLRVIGRTSSFRFRDSKEDARSIGAKLGVAYLLAGSVQRSDVVLRIRTEVVRTDDGSTLWTKQYDRPYGDLFALQDEITQAIARVLKTRLLSGDGKGQTDRPPSGNLEAYGAYLQGRFNADLGGEQDMRRAIDDMQRATRLDPKYAMAWSALSRNWTTLAALGLSGNEAREAYAQARKAGDIAIALAPELGEAHVARGWWLENSELDWRGATAEYRRALELAPEVLQTKFSVASMLALQGQLHEAITLSGEAIEDDPMSPNWWNWYGAYLSAVGRLDDAEAAMRKSIALRPQGSSAWAQLAIIEIQRGDAAAALDAARQEPEGVWRDIANAMALQASKDQPAADAALKQLIADYGDVAAFQIAQVQALRNDPDATFQWLERARETRDPGIGNTLIDPLVMRYRDDPRLAAFCRSVGLPPPTESQTKGL